MRSPLEKVTVERKGSRQRAWLQEEGGALRELLVYAEDRQEEHPRMRSGSWSDMGRNIPGQQYGDVEP